MRRSMRREGGRFCEAGQAIVESALVMPLYVFLMLGTLQIGLMHQARLVAKYAAFRAARAGALNENDPKMMEMAALAVLLPKIAFQPGLPTENPSHFFIRKNPEESDTLAAERYAVAYGMLAGVTWTGSDVPPAHVRICGPGREDIASYLNTYGRVDFDDPKISAGTEWHADKAHPGSSSHWKQFQATKLRVQVTFNYRMPIPFANRVIAQIFLGQEISKILMMDKGLRQNAPGQVAPGLGRFQGLEGELMQQMQQLLLNYQNRQYIIPIRANYNMRMMSNINPDVEGFPDSVTTNECLPWTA